MQHLSALCLRSKAYWGYDDAFLAACAEALRVTEDNLKDACAVLGAAPDYLGFVQVSLEGEKAHLDKLFVDPQAIGLGYGKRLFQWAESIARSRGATQLELDADPGAVPFYESMGMRITGQSPSEAIPGRMLPKLGKPL